MEPISKDDAVYLATLLMLGDRFTQEVWMQTRDALEAQGMCPSYNLTSRAKQFVGGATDAYFVTDKGKEALANFNKEK